MIVRRHGGPEVLQQGARPEPGLRPGHLIVAVKATSINPVDAKLRAAAAAFSLPFPAVLHGDVAGVVLEKADDVGSFAIGDDVYGCAGGLGSYDGALADRMLVDAALMAKKPASLSFREAAALPLVSITAWEALIDKMRIGEADHVLIHGATGGVGHVAIQLARHLGARVTATCSTAKMEIAASLGADALAGHDVLSTVEIVRDFADGRGFDAVLDTVGGRNLENCLKAVCDHGQVVSLTRGDADFSQITHRSLTYHGVFMLLPLITGQGRPAHGRILREIAALVDCGAIVPLLDAVPFSIWDAPAAHRHFETHRAIGKIVLTNT